MELSVKGKRYQAVLAVVRDEGQLPLGALGVSDLITGGLVRLGLANL